MVRKSVDVKSRKIMIYIITVLGNNTNDLRASRNWSVRISSRGVNRIESLSTSDQGLAFYSAFPACREPGHSCSTSTADLWLGRLTTGSDRFPPWHVWRCRSCTTEPRPSWSFSQRRQPMQALWMGPTFRIPADRNARRQRETSETVTAKSLRPRR